MFFLQAGKRVDKKFIKRYALHSFEGTFPVSYTHLDVYKRQPDPFVTWQFTEGEKGQRDYYWGRYGNSLEWAQRDFDRRVDDYQYLYHAAVKNTELGPEGVYRYYSTQRPVDIGTYPKSPDNPPLSIVNYDDDRRRPVANGRLMAWGELTYAKPLTEKQVLHNTFLYFQTRSNVSHSFTLTFIISISYPLFR